MQTRGRTGALMVGDLWSDIAFGHRAGTRAALVLSGVTTPAMARELSGESAPDGVLTDVVGLVEPSRVVAPLRTTPPLRVSLPSAVATRAASVGRDGALGALAVCALGVAAATAGFVAVRRERLK